jgi:hypothetical protein
LQQQAFQKALPLGRQLLAVALRLEAVAVELLQVLQLQ